jgi:DNA-binding LacI/PurR family transcriptional regulator
VQGEIRERRAGRDRVGRLVARGSAGAILAPVDPSTVHQSVREMSAEAVRLVLRMREGESVGAERVELSTSLVVRNSTAPPR